MDVKVVKKKGAYTFVVEGITPAFANSLRRLMMGEVPTLAVEHADFHENTSVLFDEMIAHRLGMIPLRFDAGTMNFRADCTCEGAGCQLCQTVFALEKTGPCMVTSGDLKSSNKDVQPTNPDFPIVELMAHQRLKLDAFTCLGRGKDHAKYQAAIASYQYYPSLVVEGEVESAKKVLDTFPEGMLKAEGKKLSLTDPLTASLDPVYNDGKVKVWVDGDPTTLIFRVESICGREVEDIILTAAKVLQEKAEEFKKAVGEL